MPYGAPGRQVDMEFNCDDLFAQLRYNTSNEHYKAVRCEYAKNSSVIQREEREQRRTNKLIPGNEPVI